MQYIDSIQHKDEQQGTWQPDHNPTTEWQKPNWHAAYNHYNQWIWSTSWHRSKSNPLQTEWPSRCSSIRTDPSHQALPPKTNNMPFPDEIENNNAPIYQINTHHNWPESRYDLSKRSWWQLSFQTRKKRKRSQTLKKNTTIYPSLQKRTLEN